MSDLPPSTVSPDDEQPLSSRSDQEHKDDQVEEEHPIEKREDDKTSLKEQEIEKSEDMEKDEDKQTHEEDESDADDQEDEDKTETEAEDDEASDISDDGGEENNQSSESQILHVQPVQPQTADVDKEAIKEDSDHEKETEPDDNQYDESEAEENQDDESEAEENDGNESNHTEYDKEPELGTPVHVKADEGQQIQEDQASEQADEGQKTQEDQASEQEEEKTRDRTDKTREQVSDEEKEERKKDRRSDSSEDEERQRNLVGVKKGKQVLSGEGLTKVLVSRDEEERRKLKLRSKSKKQKMRKLAKRKTRKVGGKDGKGEKYLRDSDDEYKSSDEDVKMRGYREAPFMKQYENKKHIEHILDEQHYWSDPEAKKNEFKIDDNLSSIFNSDEESESEEEVIGQDGTIIRVKKSKHNARTGDGDEISNADSEYIRLKMLKRAGSLESLASVEDTENIDRRKSKRKYNEHTLKSDAEEESRSEGVKNISKMKENEKSRNSGHDKDGDLELEDRNKENNVADRIYKTQFDVNRTKTILVKEHSDMSVDSINGVDDGKNKSKADKKIGKTRRGMGRKEEELSDFCDTDLDKLSDRDSGLDDEEGEIDVVLNKNQQQMIVNMLFDEDMNLRPQFCRDENGRIVRRLDGTVIYDPHTGRFTFRKRLGRIFKVRRLKRNDKGRPLGGYVEDEFGPNTEELAERRMSSSARKTHSGVSGRTSKDVRSASVDLKRSRSRVEGRNVGFSVPEDDALTIPDDDLEYNKRGRRDVGSAIRRTLNKRLFKKKRKHKEDILPDVKVRRAWGDDAHNHGGPQLAAPGNLTPLNSRTGRPQHSGTWGQHRTPGTGDSEHWQMYREGLESDKKILENLQGKLINKNKERPFSPKEAFVDTSGEHADENTTGYNRGYSYYSEDGRFIIRERGCPELQQQRQPLFTIVRRPNDNEGLGKGMSASEERRLKSPNLQLQEYNGEISETEHTEAKRSSNESLGARSAEGRNSENSSIDDNRLRRLLEELYRDKKYFDQYVESNEPETEAFKVSKALAEHGRGFLLERADYWEKRGPLPPRPPMTAVGWKMQREQTLAASRQGSVMNSTMTCTPDISTSNMPGLIETQMENEKHETDNAFRKSVNESDA